MNWNRGLRRASAVAWAAIAIYPAGVIAADISNGHPALQWLALLALVLGVIYALHRLTCWVIDGFTKAG